MTISQLTKNAPIRTSTDDVITKLNEVIDKLQPITLFETNSPTTGAVTLNSNITNYKRIEIFFHTNDNIYNSITVINPIVNMYFDLTSTYNYLTGRTVIKNRTCRFSTETMIQTYYTGANYWATGQLDIVNSTITQTSGNYIYIDKVIGFKE